MPLRTPVVPIKYPCYIDTTSRNSNNSVNPFEEFKLFILVPYIYDMILLSVPETFEMSQKLIEHCLVFFFFYRVTFIFAKYSEQKMAPLVQLIKLGWMQCGSTKKMTQEKQTNFKNVHSIQGVPPGFIRIDLSLCQQKSSKSTFFFSETNC